MFVHLIAMGNLFILIVVSYLFYYQLSYFYYGEFFTK